MCVLTRFGLRSSADLLPTYRDYRRVVRQARELAPGLLETAFLIGGPSACFSLSFWRNAQAIPQFGTDVDQHVIAGNNVMRRLARAAGDRPELWSTKWRLVEVSNNLDWGSNFDLRQILVADGVELP